jgi:hypothetical protein
VEDVARAPADPLTELVRELLDQGGETRNLDYKGPMAWQGSKAERAELIRDLMCFSNTPGGGHILIGVQESPAGWLRAGVTEDQAKTFDVSKLGDLAGNFCSVMPRFVVHRVAFEGVLYVVVAIDEFAEQPVVCTKDLHDEKGNLVLRAGAVYTRTTDAKCQEIGSAEDMGRLLSLAVRKQGDILLSQIASLVGERPPRREIEEEPEPFRRERDAAEEFFQKHELVGPYWQVVIRPMTYEERLAPNRLDLIRARDDSAVALRGWNFPHVDRDHSSNIGNGIQSVTKFQWHHEAHRALLSGLFAWRGLLREESEEGYRGTLMFESTIWSFTEIWLFASRYLPALVEGGEAVVETRIQGLRGRKLVATLRGIDLGDQFVAAADVFASRRRIPVAELRARHLELADADATDLIELFNFFLAPGQVRFWQDKLLNREF